MNDHLEQCREMLHKMRTSISVVAGFVKSLKPDANCNEEYLTAARSSIEKLKIAIEEMDGIVKE